ncbi:putative recQ-mediated genome instability protein [Plasmopara halstedii]
MASPSAGEGGRRQLPYDALDPQWEALEYQVFLTTAGRAQKQAPYGAYLFGRLMQSDLHHSCRPALPENVAKLSRSTIEGMCILQVVDVANVGANHENRTKCSSAGPTRTLKLGLTDGHQLVFGFEYSLLPQFSVNIPRGTKIVVENVPVRHGLLLLGPDNCQLLEKVVDSSGPSGEKKDHLTERNGLYAGVYSSALVTSQFNSSQQKQQALTPQIIQNEAAQILTPTAARNDVSRKNVSMSTGTLPSMNRIKQKAAAEVTAPTSVFVDAPSTNDDMDSDTTDPMVEHLFYSPKTPRHVNDSKPVHNRVTSSRKRPRSPSVGGSGRMTFIDSGNTASFSLLRTDYTNNVIPDALSLTITRPFQYFEARSPKFSAPHQAPATFEIRACIKSVVGFQYTTGRYQLRVTVEDCTATKEADVAEDFVTRLMGVPCSEFLRTMQTKVHVAHKWAANMQFALMNLEGIMTFDVGVAAAASGSAPLLLIDCRDFQSSDSRELLQRVKSSLLLKPR